MTIEDFIGEFSKFEKLPIKEEKMIAKKAQAGDINSTHKLALHNMCTALRKFCYGFRALAPGDLVSICYKALFDQIPFYNPEYGVYYFSYAQRGVLRSLIAADKADKKTVRVSGAAQNSAQKIRELTEQFSYNEINEKLHIRDSLLINNAVKPELSLQTIGDNTVGDPGDPGCDEESLKFVLNELLGELRRNEERVLRMSYGIGREEQTIEQICNELSLTGERVRQIKESGLRRLRHVSRASKLRPFLG